MKAGRYISAILNAASGVTSITSTRFYPVMIAQNAALPAIAYSCTYAPADPNKTQKETAYLCKATISCWSDSYTQCEDMDLAVNNALNFVEGTTAGVTVTGCEYQGSEDGISEDGANDTYKFYRSSTYEIRINR